MTLRVCAALAKHCALIAAQYLPSWEIMDYASAAKIDAPNTALPLTRRNRAALAGCGMLKVLSLLERCPAGT